VIGAFRAAVSRFLAADGFFLAAGLAFFFLVCMIPLVLLGVSTVGFVLSTEQAGQEVVGQLTRNFPVYKREISRVLLAIVNARAASGLVGTVILVFFSTPLFSASRLALHRLLGVRLPGGFFRNLARDAAMVLVLGVLLFLASTVTWVFQWFRELVLELLLDPVQVSARWIDAMTTGLSIALSTAMFYLAYRYVPRRRVRGGVALTGAILASLLWEIAKQLFRVYIRSVGLYDQIYGPFGVLIAFVMFVYYSAIVFVFGGAYVAALDARRR
jgi:YihY family inner membrane protein